MRVPALLAATLTVAAQQVPSGPGVARRPAAGYPDSVHAVRAAARALDCLGGRCFRGIPRRVIGFARDSAGGATVSLVAACEACVGGGGTVHVARAGRATVVEIIR